MDVIKRMIEKNNIMNRIETVLATRPRVSDVVFPFSRVATQATDATIFSSTEFQEEMCNKFNFKKVRVCSRLVFLIR